MRWRMLLAVLVVPPAMIVTAPTALACSCAMVPFDNQLQNADVVFTGTAVAHEDGRTGPVLGSADPLPWTFAVDRVYRGTAGERQVVVTARSGASCGAEFQVGRPYLVLASGDPAGAGLCNGTRELTGALPAGLGAGTQPVTPPASPPPQAAPLQPDPPALPWVIGIGALVAAVAAGLVVRRGRARRSPQ